MTGDTIDTVDFEILRCVETNDRPLWKNKIYEEQPEMLNGRVSVQTIGRRVDRLQDEGLLESCIISPDDIKRDLIIAFKITDEGKRALRETGRQLVLDAVRNEFFDGSGESMIDDETVRQLLCDMFQVDDEASRLVQEYSRRELLAIAALHHAEQQIKSIITEDNAEDVSRLVNEVDGLDTDIFAKLPE